jgi:hypothetical protein
MRPRIMRQHQTSVPSAEIPRGSFRISTLNPTNTAFHSPTPNLLYQSAAIKAGSTYSFMVFYWLIFFDN